MPPITLLIKPASSLCNMRCKYCFYNDVSENREVKSYGLMSIDTLKIIVEEALKYADNTCIFTFQGGEPTLAGLDFYKKLLDFQKEFNIKKVKIFNSIQTNGYIVDEEYAKFLGENNFLAGLSLDGTRDLHNSLRVDTKGNGTFDKVMSAAKLFDKHNVEYNILCVVNNYVARHTNQVYDFFKKNNFKYLQFIQCLDSFDGKKNNFSLTPERYALFLKNTFDNYYNDYTAGTYTSVRMFDNYINILAGNNAECCGMSGVCSYNLVIEGDGSVFPCDFYVIDKYKLGNIKENSFDELLKSEIAREFVLESRAIDPKCRECKWLNICRGGCRRYREPFADSKPSLNIYCKSYNDFFEYAYERMIKMACRIKVN